MRIIFLYLLSLIQLDRHVFVCFVQCIHVCMCDAVHLAIGIWIYGVFISCKVYYGNFVIRSQHLVFLSLPRKMFQHWKASHIVSVLYTSITYKPSTAYASIDGCFQPYAIACCLSVVHWQFNLICSHPHSCPNIEWKGFNTWCCKLIPRRFPFSF